jgi:hypothetical protein
MKGLATSEYMFSTEEKVSEMVDTLVRAAEKKFQCQICCKHFSSKHCLKEHGYTHTNEKPYSCIFCKKAFKHASQLSLHKKIHKVKTELQWPKLTDLLKFEVKAKPTQLICSEIVTLAPISMPQTFTLPNFNF